MFFTKTRFATITMAQAALELAQDSSIVLVDVRTPEEYAAGHIPRSINIPLQQAQNILEAVPDAATRIFVYCLSGARSRSACGIFTKLGYGAVTNIGGISAWQGEQERG